MNRRRKGRWTVSAMVLAALALAAANGCRGREEGGGKASRIDTLMKQYRSAEKFNGAALVAEGGKVLFEKGFGMADMEWSVPNAPDTRFRLASVSKQFTAALILQLAEAGQLRLEDKVSDLLPHYRKDTGSRITVHHLLNQTSGIPDITRRPDYDTAIRPFPHGVEEMVAKFCSGDLEFEPGSKFKYTNSGYIILGAIIERVTGKPYEEALRERITDPLKMASTGYDHSEPILPKRAAGYQKNPAGPGYLNARFIDMTNPYAAGGLYSTVEDLYLWDRALVGTAVLSERSKALMFSPGLEDYGYGWIIQKLPLGPGRSLRTAISHAGGINGFASFIHRIPEDGNLVVLLDNASDGALREISLGLFDVLYGRIPPPPKRSIAEALAPAFAERGTEAGVSLYRELRAREPGAYDFGEDELNTLGYRLLWAGKPDAAVAVFRLNAEAFPESSNVYDSLGEGLAAQGKRDEAVSSYEKSLRLDPANENARAMIRKLGAR